MTLPASNMQAAGGNAFADALNSPSGKVFGARAFVDSRRFRMMDRRQQFYDCKQHDGKRYDFDGRVLMANSTELTLTQPLLSSEKAAFYVPLRARRPSSPYRLSRAMVNAFTNFVFGEQRFPQIRVPGDDDSQDFVQACSKYGRLPITMVKARNLGGSVGTVGISWWFDQGKPRFRTHNGKNLFVKEWEDREALVPRHVIECYQFAQEEWVPEKKRVEDVRYWHRRDWTSKCEISFHPVKVERDKDPDWELNIDVEKSVEHNDGDPHFVWVQNQPNDDDPDGLPDYEGLYEALDELDIIVSILARGAKLNLDPTLMIKADQLFVQKFGVKKGSDNALVVDREGGDAKYLELAGTSIDAGIKLANEFRRFILETAECVIPDPDQIAAQGQSAAAQKMVFSRMISKGGIIEEQYGTAMERLLEPLLYIAQARVQTPVSVIDEDNPEQLKEAPQVFDLPPRMDQRPVQGDDGQPTGEQESVAAERHPGAGAGLELEWPPKFPPTPTDLQALVTTLTTAVPSKPVVSQQTAVELASTAFGKDAGEEWKRVQADGKADEQKQQQAMQDSQDAAGGKVPGPGAMPPGAHPGGAPPGGAPPGGGGGGGSGDEGERSPAEPPAD